MSRKRKPSNPSEMEMVTFQLEGVFEPGEVLVLNIQLGTLLHLGPGPQCNHEQIFTTSELYLLRPLLEAYPYYCPYEVLLASFNGEPLTKENIDQWRQKLYREYEERRLWNDYMRTMRGVLSRSRVKLRLFRIDIVAITETGYLLKPYRASLSSHTVSDVSVVSPERIRVLA